MEGLALDREGPRSTDGPPAFPQTFRSRRRSRREFRVSGFVRESLQLPRPAYYP
jgi:hypothetical protein